MPGLGLVCDTVRATEVGWTTDRDNCGSSQAVRTSPDVVVHSEANSGSETRRARKGFALLLTDPDRL